jgi:hypothetical protein
MAVGMAALRLNVCMTIAAELQMQS